MERLNDFADERHRILRDIRELGTQISQVVSAEVDDLLSGIQMLDNLRKTAYEETNQLQHEALLLEAAVLLEREFDGVEIKWSWNPRQTGAADEPDLQGEVDGQVVVSVEATASESPQGVIDTRMRDTLEKLSEFPGKRVYCVRTPQMQRRAETKIRKAGHDTEVLLLTPDTV